MNQGITASVDRIQTIIDDIIKNFDFNRLLDIAKRSLDWRTYIDLDSSPRGEDSTSSSKRSTPKPGYVETAVNVLFEVNEQCGPPENKDLICCTCTFQIIHPRSRQLACRYPTELKLLVIVLFIMAPLLTAMTLLIVQGFDTRW